MYAIQGEQMQKLALRYSVESFLVFIFQTKHIALSPLISEAGVIIFHGAMTLSRTRS